MNGSVRGQASSSLCPLQTAHQREKRQKLQQKRKAALEARLAKVRQRKLKQGGGGEEEEEGGGGEDGGGGGVDIAKFDFEGKKEEEEVKGEWCVCVCVCVCKDQE